MAGAGYKLFNTGDVLTAAQVNTYLQEQTVMVFASSTARTTALSGVLAEGMMSYLQDTNAVEVYNGTSWVNVGNAGDLTEIVAGTGITVTSGTGPIPTVALTTPIAATNGGTAQSTYTTGDLLYASGTNTLAKRAIGSTGHVLTVSGGVPTWAAPAGGGKVLQVVSATTSTQVTIATTTYTDTNITATITPTSSTSKVLIIIAAQTYTGLTSPTTSSYVDAKARIMRDATAILTNGLVHQLEGSSSTMSLVTQNSFVYLDSPATTSATTYKLQAGRVSGVGQNIRYQDSTNSGSTSTITLLEIGA